MPHQSIEYTFLSKVFNCLLDNEIPIVVDASARWRVSCPSPLLFRGPARPWYFSLAAHQIPEDGVLRRGGAYFSSAHVIVLDDVGTKVFPGKIPVEPHYVLETSPGNFQWGYLIQPEPDRHIVESALRALADERMTDKGAVDCVHLFRLPGSLHRTGFQARQTLAPDPRRRVRVDRLVTRFGDNVVKAYRRNLATSPRPQDYARLPPTSQEISLDEFFRKLIGLELVVRPPNGAGWAEILCPWASEHTTPNGPTHALAGRTARYLAGGGVFKCFHEHCAERTFRDLSRWCVEEEMRRARAHAHDPEEHAPVPERPDRRKHRRVGSAAHTSAR
jgi:hypothetical protein